MVTRRFAATVATLVAALFLVPDGALARAGGFGGRGFAGHGVSGFHAGSFRHAPVLRRGGLGRLGAFARRPYRRFGLDQWPWIYPGGVFYGVDGVPGDDLAAGDTGSRAMPFALYRPSCRLQTQTLVVTAERGGTREITITRCRLPLGLAAWPDQGRLRAIASGDEPAEGFGPAAEAVAGEASGDPGHVEGRACRIQTLNVASENGGERTITVHRC